MEIIIKDSVENFNKLKAEVAQENPNINVIRLLIHDIDHLINILRGFFGYR